MGNDQIPTLSGPALPRLVPMTNPMAARDESVPLPSIPGYTLLDELGRGSMGVVYRARHHGLNRQVALKMLLIGAHADPQLITRFYTETQTIAKLQHPGIVQVFDSGWCGGLPYCALELLSGGTLASRLQGKPWAPRKAAELVLSLARTIHAAHEAGVVHRDIKPANILFDAQDQPRVTDFGVAKDLLNPEGGYTQSGDIIGTPSYMAPEQACGSSHRVGREADTYALGVLLYELLTGDVPFVGQDPVDVMIQVRQLEPIPPRRRVHTVAGDLDVICMKCLEKDPRRRYATAEALADDLQRFLNDQPIHARRVSDWEKFCRWGWRNPLVACLLTGLLGIFLAAFILVSLSYWRAEKALQNAEVREKAERWERYRANLTAAAAAMQLHNVNIARDALQAAPPEHQNWEWQHFSRRLEGAESIHRMPHSTTMYVNGHPHCSEFMLVEEKQTTLWNSIRNERIKTVQRAANTKVFFSPDRRTYGIVHPQKEIVLHDLDTDRILSRVKIHNRDVSHVQFSTDSEMLCASLDKQSLLICQSRTGQLIFECTEGSAHYQNQRFSLDGKRFIYQDASRNRYRLVDLATGQVISDWIQPERKTSFTVFNRTGDRMLEVGIYPDVELHLWDTLTGSRIAVLKGHENQVFHGHFTTDGRYLASGSMDQSIRIWDARTGECLHRLQGHRGWIMALGFSPDGTRLVSGSQDHTLRMWDVRSGACLAVLLGHTDDVEMVMYSPDGRHITSWGADRTARVWNAADVERQGVIRGHTDFVYSAAFHPNGQQIASASWDGTVRLWDAVSNQELARLQHASGTASSSLAYSPDGQRLVSSGRDGTIRVWNLDTLQEANRLVYKADTWRDCRVAICPRGRLVAIGDGTHAIRLWELETQRELDPLTGHDNAIRDLAFSPDGRWLVSAGENGKGALRVWDMVTRTVAHTLPIQPKSAYTAAFSKSGRMLATGTIEGTVDLWDTWTWTLQGSLSQGSKVYSVAFTPDETRLAVGCANNSIRLWDVARRQEVGELTGHDRYVHQVAFSPDGTRLVSASGDRTLRLWNTASRAKAP